MVRSGPALAAALLVLAPAAAVAGSDDFQQIVSIPGGKVRVWIKPLGPSTAPPRTGKSPRVGVTSTVPAGGALAKKLDDSGKLLVVSPARLGTTEGQGGFDTLTRSEFVETLGATCRKGKLDFALFAATPQMGAGASPTVYLLGLGRMKQSQTFEMRLYDCRSQRVAWDQQVKVEDSQGLWTNIIAGGMRVGGSPSEEAGAGIITTKLLVDMGW